MNPPPDDTPTSPATRETPETPERRVAWQPPFPAPTPLLEPEPETEPETEPPSETSPAQSPTTALPATENETETEKDAASASAPPPPATEVAPAPEPDPAPEPAPAPPSEPPPLVSLTATYPAPPAPSPAQTEFSFSTPSAPSLLARIFAFFFRKTRTPEIREALPEDRQPTTRPSSSSSLDDGKGWIGVDLDGTLAKIGSWRGLEHVGEPVPLMLERVRHWLASGLRVKILTARASRPDGIPPVRRWLEKNGLPADLEITNAKDFSMIECWDDRAIQVVQDTGRPFLSHSVFSRPRAPILPEEAAGNTFYLMSPDAPQPPPPPQPPPSDDTTAELPLSWETLAQQSAKDTGAPPEPEEVSPEVLAIRRAVTEKSKQSKT
jgi:hypothetical protein